MMWKMSGENNICTYIGAWGRWLLVALLLYAKCYVFDVLIAQPNIVSWEMTDHLSYLAAATLLAIPVMLTRHKFPAFIILAITDMWMIANIIYYRSYRLFITWHLFSLVGNMEGFWSSILPYCTFSLLLIPLLSLPVLICLLWEARQLRVFEVLSVMLLSASLSIGAAYCKWNDVKAYLPNDHFSWEWINPCSIPQALSSDISEKERQAANYIRYRSILAYPLYMANDAICTALHSSEPEALTAEEKEELQKIAGPVTSPHQPQGNLLIVLLESFESWLLDAKDANGNPICPALNDYINTHPVLYVQDVASQIQFGMSGDGQLIVNTGLYPTMEGVACIDYGHHVYPNLAHFYPHSAVVNPCRNVWNQTVVAASYGYKRLVEPQTENRFEWNDSIVMDKIIATFQSSPVPTCVMGITVSGHIPFDSSPDDVAMADTVPELFRRYMQTAHFTDRQLGRLLAWADTAQVMQNSVIAITGDHRIFHAWMGDDIREFGLRAHLPFGTGQAGCPLIVKAPKMVSQRIVKQARQIDIYPTILYYIGQEDYFWKGMGCSLKEGEATSDENYNLRRQLSDKLIRMNYFAD